MDICQWLLQQHAIDPDFSSLMLFTDEAGFTQDGIINFRNSHVWDDENPQATFQSRHQHRFSIIFGQAYLGQTDWSFCFAIKVGRVFSSQLQSHHSARVTERCPFGKNSADVVYA
jgi:hypothetical protein